MADSGSVDWSEGQIRARRRAFQRALAADLMLHLAVGLGCLLAPQWVAALAGTAESSAVSWVRAWGAAIILICALYFPGLQDPLRSRYPNLVGALGRIGLAVAWFVAGGRLIWFGLVDLSFAIVLGWLYYRYCIAEIMNRP